MRLATLALIVTVGLARAEAGFVDGLRSSARFNRPTGLALDAEQSRLYIADTANHVVRALDLATGRVATVWPLDGGPECSKHQGDGSFELTAARLCGTVGNPRSLHWLPAPTALALDGKGGLYIAETHNLHYLRLDSGKSEIVANENTEPPVRMGKIFALAFAGDGKLYVTDSMHHVVRVFDPESRAVTVLAGTWNQRGHRDGMGKAAQLEYPAAMVADESGHLWVSEWWRGALRRITIATGAVETVAVKMRNPTGLSTREGRLVAFDLNADVIWRVHPEKKTLALLAGQRGKKGARDGSPALVGYDLEGNWGALPTGMVTDKHGWLYFTASGQHLVRRVRLSDGQVETLAGASR